MVTIATVPGTSAGTAHFRPFEYCCGHCGLAWAAPELLEALEWLRSSIGRPIRLASGNRCPVRNEAVGGVRNSQHIYGLAVDLATPISLDAVRRAGRFSGIGHDGTRVIHVDMRHLVAYTNVTRSTPEDPAIWTYGAGVFDRKTQC